MDNYLVNSNFHILQILITIFITWYLTSIRYKSLQTMYEQILSQKKSSEVRTGKIAESLAPLTNQFPVDVTKAGTATVFVGQPLDYIHFDPEEGITFIEIKSGKSALSSSQKQLRKAIEEGRVFWEEVRID